MSEQPKTIEDRLVAMEKAINTLMEQKQTEEPFSATALSRQERMAKVLSEWNAQKEVDDLAKIKAFDEARAKAFDEKFAAYKAETEKSDEEVLRRFLGVNKDETLKMSDVPKLLTALRKASLEKTEKERGPAATEKAGPEGNKPEDPIDKAFKPYLEEEAKK